MLKGSELEALSDEDLDRLLTMSSTRAARNTTRIVNRLRNRDHIVAVTGDGLTTPRLYGRRHRVSMGITGTDVSKETADMVLADDNFATIFAAIGGACRLRNIRKAIFFLLSTNAGEVDGLSALLIGLPLPLVPVQILWMNLVTDSAPVIALGFEPGESSFKGLPPS